jgi:hypothetical protein
VVVRDRRCVVSNYHTYEAFHERLAARQAKKAIPATLGVFYHIACMINWQEVVTEQLRLLSFVGLTEANACVLGSQQDADWCISEAARLGVVLRVPFVAPDISLCEGPTLQMVHDWARDNPDGAALYFHTKAVSRHNDGVKTRWRHVMAKHVIGDWGRCLDDLAVADMCGVAWHTQPGMPYFAGNFWMARCDWIRHLQPIEEYRTRHGWGFQFCSQGWRARMYAETWVGSEPWHHVQSYCGYNVMLCNHNVFSLPWEVDGFCY